MRADCPEPKDGDEYRQAVIELTEQLTVSIVCYVLMIRCISSSCQAPMAMVPGL